MLRSVQSSVASLQFFLRGGGGEGALGGIEREREIPRGLAVYLLLGLGDKKCRFKKFLL